MLNLALHEGSGNPRRIVLVHGFTQTGEVWRDLAVSLAAKGFEVLAPDMPGHGETDPRYDRADLWEAGRLIGEVGGRATYVGYSYGARALLHLCLRPGFDSEVLERVVLVGAKGGPKIPAEAKARVEADERLADRIDELGRAGRLAEFVDEWLMNAVNARLPEEARYRDIRLANRYEGLSSSLRFTGSGTQEPLWGRLGDIDVPALVAFGQHDIASIIDEGMQIARAIGPNSEVVEFAEAGHAVPFECPGAFESAVVDFMDRR